MYIRPARLPLCLMANGWADIIAQIGEELVSLCLP